MWYLWKLRIFLICTFYNILRRIFTVNTFWNTLVLRYFPKKMLKTFATTYFVFIAANRERLLRYNKSLGKFLQFSSILVYFLFRRVCLFYILEGRVFGNVSECVMHERNNIQDTYPEQKYYHIKSPFDNAPFKVKASFKLVSVPRVIANSAPLTALWRLFKHALWIGFWRQFRSASSFFFSHSLYSSLFSLSMSRTRGAGEGSICCLLSILLKSFKNLRVGTYFTK